jgi:hypothetical protein
MMSVGDYFKFFIIFQMPFLICAFIPLVAIASGVAWYGRKRHRFVLPSTNKLIRVFQIALFTLLAALCLAHLEAKWNIFSYCFESYGQCPAYAEADGLPIIPDALAEQEAILRHLLPPSMRDNCYLGNEIACQYTSRYMVNQPAVNLWLVYPGIWFFALAQALIVLAFVRRIFPDTRKQKRSSLSSL